MSEQAECERESEKKESRADKAVKELIKYKKRDEERGNLGVDDDRVDWSWRSAEAKIQVLGVLDFLGSIFGFIEAAILRTPFIAVAAAFAMLLGVYLMS